MNYENIYFFLLISLLVSTPLVFIVLYRNHSRMGWGEKLILIIFLNLISINAKGQNSHSDYYANSINFLQKKDFTNALININKAIEKDPQNHAYIAYKGHILRNNNNYEDALIFIEKAIELNSDTGWYYVEAVMITYHLKNLILAKKYCDKALILGKIKLGDSNYSYIKSINDNLKQSEYILTFKFNPKNPKLIYNQAGILCLPVPTNNLPYQKTTYKIINATLVKTEKEQDFELIYIKPTGNADVSIICTITKIPYSYSEKIKNLNSNGVFSNNIKQYLKGSDRLDIDSEIIREISDKLKAGTTVETVLNTIKWINTFKYGTPPSWKKVSDLISKKIVECGTGSLTVVALLRKNKIPARQVWGPIDAGRTFSPQNYLKGHAWFEFYLKGVGWIPVEQFDISTVGFLPISYIRMMTNKDHLYENIPLANIMTIMHNNKYGDIVEYKRKIIGE